MRASRLMDVATPPSPVKFGPLRLVRGDHRVLAGVASGIGARVRIEPTLIRSGFVVLSLAGGFGVALYLILTLVSVEPGPEEATAGGLRSGAREVLGISAIVFGLLIILRQSGFWLGDAIVWPVALAILGAMFIWIRGEPAARVGRRSGLGAAELFTRGGLWRIGLGALLVVGGAVLFLRADNGYYLQRTDAGPAIVTLFGISLIFGPWLWRLGHQLAEERRERIRADERSEMAAHLHDSVLQTLALIQRAPGSREMATLARVQERELRAWLYGRTGSLDGAESLSAAVDAIAGRIEEVHNVAVESVVVGDSRLDDRSKAVIAACGEALSNAARHSGAHTVSLYVEVGSDAVTAFVRDQGSGFTLNEIAPDRGGIAQSIRGRVERQGGSASIIIAPGEGTEVQLRVPRKMVPVS